jgi:hypothetical protein
MAGYLDLGAEGSVQIYPGTVGVGYHHAGDRGMTLRAKRVVFGVDEEQERRVILVSLNPRAHLLPQLRP